MSLLPNQKRVTCAAFAAVVTAVSGTDAASIPGAFAKSAPTAVPTKMAVGDCLPRSDMISALSAEGQVVLVVDDAEGYSSKDGSEVFQREAYTTNSTFTAGISMSQIANGDYCKTANLSKIKLFDARSGTIDARAFFQPMGRSESGTLNAAIKKRQETRGQVPMMQAYVASSGVTITVAGNQHSKTGVVLYSKDDGRLNGSGSSDSVGTQYSPDALQYLADFSPKN